MPYLEFVEGIRNRGKMVKVEYGYLPDGYGRNYTDTYTSIYTYPDSAIDGIKASCGVRGYSEDVYAGKLHFDFDSFENDMALIDVRLFLEKICHGETDIPIDNFLIWYTGSKGFHVFLKSEEIENMESSKDTPEKIKAICIALAGEYSSFDRSVYDKQRIWRLSNSMHKKTGLYKIPLLANEVLIYSLDTIKELAKKQRTIKIAVEQHLKYLKTNKIGAFA